MSAPKLATLGLVVLVTGCVGTTTVIKANATPAIQVPCVAELPDESRQLLSSAREASDRAQSLTTQLLTFAKGGAPIRRAASIQDLLRESATDDEFRDALVDRRANRRQQRPGTQYQRQPGAYLATGKPETPHDVGRRPGIGAVNRKRVHR